MKTIDGRKPKFHPNCLFLSWTTDGPTPQYTATWCSYYDIDLKAVKWSSRIKWKDLKSEILVATDYVGQPFTVVASNPYRNKSYLKSHLQKVIRRSNAYKALKTAWHYIDLDLHDFLRRLAIIAIEDCLPLEGFSTLIWFMAATSKGYALNMEQICWVLGYVYDLAKTDSYEQFEHKDLSLRQIRMRTLSQEGKDLVYSIMFRQAYGGMSGDKKMCSQAGYIWSARYQTKSLFISKRARKIIFVSPPSNVMSTAEWVIPAIDFHCCPNIITAMWEKHDDISEEKIKSAIWHCSSSVTNKINIAPDLGQRDCANKELQAIWKTIRKDFLSYARFMLDKNH